MEKIKTLNLTVEQIKILEKANDVLEEIEEFADGDLLGVDLDQMDIFENMVGMSSNILDKCCEIY